MKRPTFETFNQQFADGVICEFHSLTASTP